MKFKEIILSFLLISLSMNVVGYNVNITDHHNTEDELIVYCKELSKLSGRVMMARQNGVPVATLMNAPIDKDIRELFKSIILKAYETPRYDTIRMRQRAINDYHNIWYVACIKEYR